MGREEAERWALAEQHGAVSRDQAVRLGQDERQIRRRVDRRQWARASTPGWFIVAGAPDRWLGELVAATSATGGLATGWSTLRLSGVTEVAELRPHIVVARTNTVRPRGVRLSWPLDFSSYERRFRRGVPTVDLELAIASLAADLPPADFDDLLDRALRERATTWDRLEPVLRAWSRRGRRGSALVQGVLADRSAEAAVPLSSWSRQIRRRLSSAGVGRPTLEYRVLGPSGRLVAQVDLAFPDLRYAIELDGVAFHLDRESFERDRHRDAELAIVGWLCRRFTWEQTETEWSWVEAVIRNDLRRLGRPSA